MNDRFFRPNQKFLEVGIGSFQNRMEDLGDSAPMNLKKAANSAESQIRFEFDQKNQKFGAS